MKKIINKIPAIISSDISIYLFLFLFLYLVLFPVAGYLIPQLKNLIPSNMTQLVLGNYTNVLSALGAAIAAGAGVKINRHVKKHLEKHEELKQSVADLHAKVDQLLDTK